MATKFCVECQTDRPASTVAGRVCRKCIRDKRVKNGLCRFCYQAAVPEKTFCQKHLDLQKRGAKRRRLAVKLKVIAHYGGKCALCPENRPIFLTLDHVNDDGAAHRKELGNKRVGSYIYIWTIKNNYPDWLQLLCYNCNGAKAAYGLEALLRVLNGDQIALAGR